MPDKIGAPGPYCSMWNDLSYVDQTNAHDDHIRLWKHVNYLSYVLPGKWA